MRSTTRRHRWSMRAVGLFTSSVLCVTRGVLYLPPVANGKEGLPLGVDALTSLVPAHIGTIEWQPVWLFGAAWLAVGIAGMVDVFRARQGHTVYRIMVGLFAGWAIGYLGSTALLGSRSGWASGMVFAYVAINTELARRRAPRAPAPVSSATIAARLKVIPAPEQVFFYSDGEWVEIHPGVTDD